jgi:hypothetical protein
MITSLTDIATTGPLELETVQVNTWEDQDVVRALMAYPPTSAYRGVLVRLAAGLTSLRSRRDGNVLWHASAEGGQIAVTLWSTGGTWSDRAWWGRAVLRVEENDYRQQDYEFSAAEFIVVGSTGGLTRFTGDLVGRELVSAYRAILGRESLREMALIGEIGHESEPEPLATFLAEVAASFAERADQAAEQHARIPPIPYDPEDPGLVSDLALGGEDGAAGLVFGAGGDFPAAQAGGNANEEPGGRPALPPPLTRGVVRRGAREGPAA